MKRTPTTAWYAKTVLLLHHIRLGNMAEVRVLEETLKRLNQEHRRRGQVLVFDRNLSSQSSLQALLNCGYDYITGLSLNSRLIRPQKASRPNIDRVSTGKE